MGNSFYLFIFLLLQITTLSYGDEKTVKIATLPDYAPFCMTTGEFKTNQTVQVGKDAVGFGGYSWDVLRESFHEMGYTIDLYIVPWARAMSYFENGKVDIIFPAGKNSERENKFYYSEESINEAKFVVYLRADDPIEWKSLDSLTGLTIGVKRGFNYGNKWNAAVGIKKIDMGTILQGFKMLSAKRLDGFLGYEYNWDYVLKKENWNTKYRKLPCFNSSSEYPVTLKSNPNGRELLKVFDIGKKRVVETGKFEKIKGKWFGTQ